MKIFPFNKYKIYVIKIPTELSLSPSYYENTLLVYYDKIDLLCIQRFGQNIGLIKLKAIPSIIELIITEF